MRTAALLVITGMILALTACSGPGTPAAGQVDGVTIATPNGATVTVGDTLQLEVDVATTGSVSSDVTWSSSVTAVAEVDTTGLVTGKLVGETTVTATSVADGNKSDSTVVEAVTCPAPTLLDTDITTDTTWSPNVAGCVAYIVEGRGFILNAAVLTIEPGTHIVFRQDAGLWAVDAGSAINAVGTAAMPITFEGESEQSGFWKGLAFSTNTPLNELTHVVVDGAGSSLFDGQHRTNVFLRQAARLKLTNSTIRNGSGYGLYLAGILGDLSGFANNVFEGNAAAPLRLPSNVLGDLDSASDYSGPAANPNGDAFVEAGASDTTVDQTWIKIDLPYRMGPINGHNITGAHVTIEPGAVFEFEANVELNVYSDGALTAIGTVDEPIVFRGFAAGTGVWDGILFGSNDPRNELQHVEVDGAGAGNLGSSVYDANVAIHSNSRAKLSDSTFSNSGSYGVFINTNGGMAEPADPTSVDANNTFSGNVQGAVGTN